MEFDQQRQAMLDEMESTILLYVGSVPLNDSMDDLKEELEQFGFTLGRA